MPSSVPSLEKIRDAHKADEAYISDCIDKGDVGHLMVSKGVFAQGFEAVSPQERRSSVKARIKARS